MDVPSISWVVTGFLLTQATLLALAGRAGDLYGRRRVFVIGVLVLCTGSILCALAWNAPSLVAFRILQAVGACAMAPTAYSYAAELFGPRERGAALGVMGGVLGLAPGARPQPGGRAGRDARLAQRVLVQPRDRRLRAHRSRAGAGGAAPRRCRPRLRPARRRTGRGGPVLPARRHLARRGLGVDQRPPGGRRRPRRRRPRVVRRPRDADGQPDDRRAAAAPSRHRARPTWPPWPRRRPCSAS